MPKPHHDAALNDLRDAYLNCSLAKDRTARQIRQHYAERAEQDIQAAREALDQEMAERFRKAVEARIPASRIRAEVLKTNVWERWLYWKNIGGF